MAEITLLTNTQWVEMVEHYNKEKTDEAFNEIFRALEPLSIKLGHKWYNRNRAYNVPAEDFVSMAQFAIFEAVRNFDGSQGSKFVSFYKKYVGWVIQDNIVKKQQTKSAEFERNAYYLEHTVGNSEGEAVTFMDMVESQVGVSEAEVYGAIVDPDSDAGAMVTRLLDLVGEFEMSASVDDGAIVRTVLNTVMSEPEANAKMVNNVLADLFPDVKPATLRKKKQRAVERFTKFAKENGLGDMNLSQF